MTLGLICECDITHEDPYTVNNKDATDMPYMDDFFWLLLTDT